MPLKFSISKNVINLNLSTPLLSRINVKNHNITNLSIKPSQTKLNICGKKIKINIKRICG